MKILMISDVYFPRINGVSTSIESFRRALGRLGHSVTLICPSYPAGHADAPDILRIPSRGVLTDPEDRMMHYRRILALAPELAAQGFDLIHVHTPFVAHYAGRALGRRLALPVIETCHTLFEEYLHHYLTWLPPSLLRFAARRVAVQQCQVIQALIAPSTAMRDALLRYGVTRPVSVVATGLPLETLAGAGTHQASTAETRQRHAIAADAPLLLFVGRAAHEKNIAFLIAMLPRVLARHPRATLVIAGEGPAREALTRQARAAGVAQAVRFIGYLARDGELQALYRAADAFVFASRTETQGLVLLEAMALGTPVVSTAVMGTRDVLCEGEGCLIAEDDEEAFAATVNRLLDDDALRLGLAQRAIAYAEHWHEDAQAAALDCYATQLSPGDGRAPSSVGSS